MDCKYKHLYLLVYVLVPSCSPMPISLNEQSYWFEFLQQIIIYKVNPQLNVDPKVPVEKYIEDAIHEYETHTCIRFQKWKNNANFIEFQWGHDRTFRQGYVYTDDDGNIRYNIYINIGPELLIRQDTNNHNRGKLLRWISKAIGFLNEHQRPDRDLFIHVDIDNVHYNLYGQYIDSNYIDPYVPYDYLSITHLPSVGFPAPNKAIITHDPSYEEFIGNYNHLSFFDIMAVNKALECGVKNCIGADPCPPLSFRGEDCKCHCSAVSEKLANEDYLPNLDFKRRLELAIATSVNHPTEVCGPPSFVTSQCPDGWDKMVSVASSSNDICYREFPESLTWNEAAHRCIALGARLASPRNSLQSYSMVDHHGGVMTGEFAWLNVKFEDYRRYQAWVVQDTGTHIGSDVNLGPTWLMAYHNFDLNELEAFSPIDTCIAIDRNGKWRGKTCTLKAPSLICQKRLQCQSDWFYKSGHCYKPITHVDTWQKQKDQCQRYHADLASSLSREDNWFLTQFLAPIKSAWLNLRRETPSSRWKWMDTDKELDLNTWLPYWRKDWLDGSEWRRCMLLDRDGWWMDRNCDTKASAICKKRAGRPPGQYTFVGCEGEKVDIRCDPWGLIRIHTVLYGRATSERCPSAIDDIHQVCLAPYAYAKLFRKCQFRRKCAKDLVVDIALNENIDPCPGVSKYLQVEYDCKQEYVENEECPHFVSVSIGPSVFGSPWYMERSNVNALWVLRRCGSGQFYYPDECRCSVGGDFAAIATHVTAPRMLLVSLSATLVCFVV